MTAAIICYVIFAMLLYLSMMTKCNRDPVVWWPKNKWIFWALAVTFGLPMALVGWLVAFILTMCGKRPKRYAWALCYELDINFGISLGLVFLVPEGNYERMKEHEYGHCIQNACFGIFFPAIVAIPSAIRFWYREIREKLGKPCTTLYDDIWFENSATKTGNAFMTEFRKR